MPRLQRNRYLTCFYCGRKTSTRYDGRIRRFDCPDCDATNFLDENGDITDPPVATDREATPARQYAVPRALSPPSSPTTEAIFCQKCLKNQHLLSASLAQYLPDPDDPDYAERERTLYRFRKNQERRYPQICADCEPRVRQRLEKAAYTAKTDLLRRMLDRSASARKSAVRTGGWPERFDVAGRWVWVAGFVLQLAWHSVAVHALLSRRMVRVEEEDALPTFRVLRACDSLVAALPPTERLLRWSIVASFLAAWWNPRFAQIYRGFTKHISGVSKWYIYQAMTVLLRVGLPKAWDMTTPDPRLLNMQIASHAFGAAFALLIFILSPRSIRVNMAPLFGSPKPLQLHDERPSTSSSRPDETKSMAELLDEISRSPTSSSPPSPVTDVSPSIPRRAPAPPMGHVHRQAAQTLTTSLQHLNTLHLSPSSAAAAAYGVTEMDWDPTPPTALTAASPDANPGARSKYRAFNTQGTRTSQPFGSAPTSESRSSPFWYRGLPPAPTTPAQRVFNPPNQPRLRPSPIGADGKRWGFGQGQGQEQAQVQAQEQGQGQGRVRFRGPDRTTLVREGEVGPGDGGKGTGGGVAFAEPSFFAESVVGRRKGESDPRDGLMGLFGEGLRLEENERRERGGGGWFRKFVGGGGGGEKGKKG
ncbi:hypothetical protein VTK26DRAFT_5475 [Humicola hyalothermophila]